MPASAEIRAAGLYKSERVIKSPQDARINVAEGEVLNMCANNYLGLSDHPAIVKAAHKALDDWGYGLSSVRFICGTQEIHKELEAKISEFLGMEDTILYTSCFDANGGLFETILSDEDADALDIWLDRQPWRDLTRQDSSSASSTLAGSTSCWRYLFARRPRVQPKAMASCGRAASGPRHLNPTFQLRSMAMVSGSAKV